MTFEFRRVVVDIPDPDAAEQPTLAAALEIAAKGKVRFCLVHNVFHRDLQTKSGHQDQLLDEARDLLLAARHTKLLELADTVRTTDTDFDIEVTWAPEPFLELVRIARDQKVDLVISSTQPRTRWERMRLSNQDWQLIRYCPSSLLLVKSAARFESRTADSEAGKRYARALAAIDPLHADDKPASLDHRILEAAKSMCELYSARLDVINVVMPVLSAAPTVAEPLLATDTMAQEAATEAHQKRARALLAEHALNNAGINVMVGEPADQIVEFAASQQIDLLIMGAVARSALGRLLIGNTAEKVLDAVASDLLIIKPVGVNTDPRSNSAQAG